MQQSHAPMAMQVSEGAVRSGPRGFIPTRICLIQRSRTEDGHWLVDDTRRTPPKIRVFG